MDLHTIIVRVNKYTERSFWATNFCHKGDTYFEGVGIRVEEWFSEPILLDVDVTRRLHLFLLGYHSRKQYTRISEGLNEAYQKTQKLLEFEPQWTAEFVAKLNEELSNTPYRFVADKNDGSFLEAFRFPVLHKSKPRFVGKVVRPPRSKNEDYSYTPFKNVKETIRGILLMSAAKSFVPGPWLRYVIENTTEDLSELMKDYWVQYTFDIKWLCQPNGEVRQCFKQADFDVLNWFKTKGPGISFKEACEQNLQHAIDWYVRYGADPSIYIRSEEHHLDEHFDDFDDLI